MRWLRKLFQSHPSVRPVQPPVMPLEAPDADDWMGESWIWEPGDLDDEEAGR